MATYEERQKWLQELKPGDEVLVWQGRGHDAVGTVERTTATQVIVRKGNGGEQRFNKKSGTVVGGGYSPKIEPVTQRALEGIKTAANRSEFTMAVYRPDRLTDDEIAVMLEALRALRAAKEGGE